MRRPVEAPGPSVSFLRSWRLLPALLFGVGAVLAGSGETAAQVAEELVAERDLEYRSTRSAHDAALDARAAADRRFTRALQEIEEAKRENEEDRVDAAYARAQQQALELQRLEQRVRETAARLEETRSALVDALDRRLGELAERISEDPDPGRREELVSLYRDLSNRIREVEGEVQLQEDVQLVAAPEISFDPRDTPLDLRWKAELLERRAEQYEVRLAEIGRLVEDLERRARRNRNLQDMLAGIERFDDDRLPVTAEPDRASASAGGGEESASTDEEGEGAGTRTLDERIENLKLLRERIEFYREQVLRRARLFRERAQEIS